MEKEGFQKTENPLIDEILQKYRDCSTDSISGPKGFGDHRIGKKPWPNADSESKQRVVTSTEPSRKPCNAVYTSPARMYAYAKERGSLKFKETLVDQFPLACFSYGGEKRLCFKELVEKVLKGFSTQAINSARDRLQIFCPRCSPQQLEVLKLAGVLPWSCTSAGLITKSDAFRLIGVLTGGSVPRRSSRLFSVDSLEVYHECFGGCVGTLEIDLYTDPYADCITCSHCDGVFSPRTFVTHHHTSGEVHTCHWGFDSAQWRLYLMLCNDHPTLHVQKLWETLTNKFTNGPRSLKREHSESEVADTGYNSSESRGSPQSPDKKPRRSSESHDSRSSHSPDSREGELVYSTNGGTVTVSSEGRVIGRRSAFRPWSPVGYRMAPTGRTLDKVSAQSANGIPFLPSSTSPGRIFAPTTISYMNSDCRCASQTCHHRNPYPPVFKSPSAGCEEGPAQSKFFQGIATPSARDPMSLEKTAKDMLDVVAQNEQWSVFKNGYSLARERGRVDPRQVVLPFSEEHIYQILIGYTRNGELPSARELSAALSKELKEFFTRQEIKIRQVLEEKINVEDDLEALKQEHAKKIEEAYDDLKKSQKELRLLQARYRDETQELKSRIIELEADLRKSKLEGGLGKGSKESIEVLQQEMRDLCIKLEQKDMFCQDLENEIKTLHGWIKNQRLHNPASGYLCGVSNPRRAERSVIRSSQFVNGSARGKINTDQETLNRNGTPSPDRARDINDL